LGEIYTFWLLEWGPILAPYLNCDATKYLNDKHKAIVKAQLQHIVLRKAKNKTKIS
jgi:hypothetical protein